MAISLKVRSLPGMSIGVLRPMRATSASSPRSVRTRRMTCWIGRLGAGLIGGDTAEQQVVLHARGGAEPRRIVEFDGRLQADRQHPRKIAAGRHDAAPPSPRRSGRDDGGSRCSAERGRSGAPGRARSGRHAGSPGGARPDPRNRADRRRRRTRSARRADGRRGSRRRSRSCCVAIDRPIRASGLVRSSASRIARMNGWPASRSSRKVSPIAFPNRRFSPIVA